jgi:soluble lytic murein transglycosylase-like protein
MFRKVLALLTLGLLVLGARPVLGHDEPQTDASHLVPTSASVADLFLIPFQPLPAQEDVSPSPPVRTDMRTTWGFGARENQFNETILHAVQSAWPYRGLVLPPTLFKSVIATESAFNPQAISATGARGLVQLTPDTARRFGLSLQAAHDPHRAVPAGVKVLAEKARAIVEPARYHELLGRRAEDCPYAARVAEAYQLLGPPSPDECWPLVLAAYNGGGGTVLRAMAVAWERGLDPRRWENLVGDPAHPQDTPLYLACVEIYRHGAAGKYREMRHYPEKVMRLYRSH